MITKREAVDMSIRKWSEYPVDTSEECGFCVYNYFARHLNNCDECPLFPIVCAVPTPCYPNTLYKKYRNKPTRKLQQQILTAIKERGEKWIKGEL